MKILKQGDLERLKKSLQFTCKLCGCVFEANDNEYVLVGEEWLNGNIEAVCNCPCCKENVFTCKDIDN